MCHVNIQQAHFDCLLVMLDFPEDAERLFFGGAGRSWSSAPSWGLAGWVLRLGVGEDPRSEGEDAL